MNTVRTMVATASLLTLANCAGSSPEPMGELDSGRTESTRITESAVAGSTGTVASSAPPVGAAVSVEWGFVELMAARAECSRDPWNCDVDDLAVTGSPAHRDLSAYVRRHRRYGITASTEGAQDYSVDGIDVISPDLAHVSVCITDDVVLTMKVPGGGPAAIYDESMSSYRMVFVTERTADGWRWVNFTTTDRAVGANLCAA